MSFLIGKRYLALWGALYDSSVSKKMCLKCDSMASQGAWAWEVTAQMFLKVLRSLGTITVLDGLLASKTYIFFLKWLVSSIIWNRSLVAIFELLWLPWLVQQQGGCQADSKGRVSWGQAVKGMGVKANREKKEQEDTWPLRIRGWRGGRCGGSFSQLFTYLPQQTFQSSLQDTQRLKSVKEK